MLWDNPTDPAHLRGLFALLNFRLGLTSTRSHLENQYSGKMCMRCWFYMVMGAALLMKCGYASGQELAPPARGTPTAATFDWLSPSSLTMVRPQDFNWSQFPLLLNVNENAGYNDNILGLPTGQNGPAHQLRGDSFAQTGVGASTRFYSGAQSFFADASYGVTNYTHD